MKRTVSIVLTLLLCLALTVPALAETYHVSPMADSDTDVTVSDVEIEAETPLTEDPSKYIYLQVDPITIPYASTRALEKIEEDNGQLVAEVIQVKLMMDIDGEDSGDEYPKDISGEVGEVKVTTTFERESSGTVVAVWAYDGSSGTWVPITFSATGNKVTCTFTTLTYDCVVFMVADPNAKPGGETEPSGGRKSPQTGDNSLWLVCGTVALLGAAGFCYRKSRRQEN